MKSQPIKKLLVFIIMMVFSVSILVFYNSCQKEISTPIKTNDALKANVSSSSPIVYIDVVPDSNVTGGSASPTYNLDLNNDGIYDFTFYVGVGRVRCGTGLVSLSSAKVSPIGSLNAIMDSGKYPGALDTNTVIGKAGIKWSSATLQILRSFDQCLGWPSRSLGNWNAGEDKYLGLKLIKGADIFYGWIRLTVNIGWLIVRDYAYNSSSNKQILAGQTK